VARVLLVAALALLGATLMVACSPEMTPPATATVERSDGTATPAGISACTVIATAPTPSSTNELPPITPADYVRGPGNAAVTMLLYCDFQSPQCEIFNRVLDQLVQDHPSDLRVVMRPYPVPVSAIPSLDKSEFAAQAAIAAGNQGKFWEMRDLLHSKYSEWSADSLGDFKGWIVQQAPTIGLDAARFDADLSDPEARDKAQGLYDSAVAMGISSIPTVFINGRLQERAAMSYDGLESTIGLTALGARQFQSCPPFSVDPSRQYTATLHTEKGDIVIRLFVDRAPLTVNSFVFLARNGWYNGVTFHRVIPGFVAQAGDPSGTGRGGPGYMFQNEVTTDLHYDKPGVVGMANAGPDTNGSQFFITYAPEPQLDGGYTVFGQVISGMDVVESLTARDPQTSASLPPGDKILSVDIEEH
jgi:cyclophilin family peptidyl-prolyl cis-trans isomerase/protein-disulfide isomerase